MSTDKTIVYTCKDFFWYKEISSKTRQHNNLQTIWKTSILKQKIA
jgi:hypothetical protein